MVLMLFVLFKSLSIDFEVSGKKEKLLCRIQEGYAFLVTLVASFPTLNVKNAGEVKPNLCCLFYTLEKDTRGISHPISNITFLKFST